MTKDEAREAALYYARSGREAELTKKLSHDGFEYRGQARSRYRSRLFKQGRERPSNEQFDEGFDAGYDFAKSESNDRAVIDGFLIAVEERQNKLLKVSDFEYIAYYDATREVYAEMFGGQVSRNDRQRTLKGLP